MKNLALINYWNRFYATNKHMQASSFARFVNRKIIRKRTGNLIDIGCGNGRDCLFFSRNGHNVLGIDMSAEAILSNSRFSNKKLKRNRYKFKMDPLYSSRGGAYVSF